MAGGEELTRMEQCFKALGNAHRIQIVQILHAKPGGLTIGALQTALDIPWSTLSHHLNALTRAHLIEQQRQGREVFCTLSKTGFRQLATKIAVWGT